MRLRVLLHLLKEFSINLVYRPLFYAKPIFDEFADELLAVNEIDLLLSSIGGFFSGCFREAACSNENALLDVRCQRPEEITSVE
jgi:hypothetical protein